MRLPGVLTIAAIGRLRTPHWSSAQEEYLGRLRRYVEVALFEIQDVAGRNLPTDVALRREGQKLLTATKASRWRIALDPAGREMDSLVFARHLDRLIQAHGKIAFLIGGPFGLSPDVLEVCDERLSLSRLTFPHELARVTLLEQLYRAVTILSGEPYHK